MNEGRTKERNRQKMIIGKQWKYSGAIPILTAMTVRKKWVWQASILFEGKKSEMDFVSGVP